MDYLTFGLIKLYIKAKVTFIRIDYFKQKCHNILIILFYKENLRIILLHYQITVCRFRTCNKNLPFESGHWANILRHEIDEIHYIPVLSYDNSLQKERIQCL